MCRTRSLSSIVTVLAYVASTTSVAYAQDRQSPAPMAAPPPGTVIVQGQPPPPSPVYLQAVQAGQVVVRIAAPQDVTLELKSRDTRAWQPVCNAPCNVPVPLDADYRVVGEGMRSTSTFKLVDVPGRPVDVEVEPASKASFGGGIALLSVGGAAVVIGLTVALVGAVANDTDGLGCGIDNPDPSSCPSNSGNGLVTGGLVTAAVGAAALVGGIVLTVSNAHSSTRQAVASWLPPLPGRPQVAWTASPTDGAGEGRAVLPRFTGLPLLSHSF